jgi:chromosome segregation ATPase
VFKRLEELATAIERQDTELAKLLGSEFHDEDGSKRAAYDAQIKELDEAVRVGAQASSRLDLVKIKLNDLDARIDEQRRKLPELNRNVNDAQSALAEIEKNIAANIYTPEALKAAEQGKAQADDALAAALTKLELLKKEQQTAAANLRDAKAKFTAAQNTLKPLQQARDEASDLLTDALTRRVEAQKSVDDAQKDVDDLQDKLDALPENDPTRTELVKQLNDAKETLAQAETKLKTVQGEADAASKAKDKADKDFAAADTKLNQATKARDSAQQAGATADAALEKQNATVAAAQDKALKAESDVVAQEQAKVELALLRTRKLETEGTLESARESLMQVETRIAALEKDAEPRREEFTKELAIVKAGEEARDKLRDVRRDRDRYQAAG